MPLYQYVKEQPFINRHDKRKTSRASLFFMAIGSGILIWSLWPIIMFSLFTAPLLSSVTSPISSINSSSTAYAKDETAYSITPVTDSSKNDYTNPNIWFPTKPQKKIVTPVNTYTISIPKLGIDKALVVIAGDDLNKSLIHYGGTGIPGQYGTAVVFGHSVLPQFFNPKNYMTIFSTLPTIKIGDDIFVTYDGVQYTYKIDDMIITEPNDLTPLEQRFDDSHITLVTCVPPGLKTARLNVKATIVHPT